MTASAQPPNPYHDIYQQFVDNAAFLWVLRNSQLTQPQVFADTIRELDARIQANLDGIMLSLEDSWEIIALAASQFEQGGEAFVMAATAYRSEDVSKIQRATEFGVSNEQTFKGLISALAWLPGTQVHPWLKQFFNSKNLDHKWVAIGTCSLRREDPAQYLNQILSREDCRAHLPLYARCLRLIGELKRQDLIAELTTAISHDDPSVKFWALWSSMLLGQRQHAELFQPYIFEENPWQAKALHMAFRVLPIAIARRWIGELAQNPETTRLAIQACGVLGDPVAVDWLMAQMETDELARVAGEAFYMISGLNLTAAPLYRDAPTQNLSDEDQDVSPDFFYDDSLPWPNVTAVVAAWQANKSAFEAGQRYFLGLLVAEENPSHLACRYVRHHQLFAKTQG